MSDRPNDSLTARLKSSRIFQDYQTAFGEATGLPVSFASAGKKTLPFRDNRFANPFCNKMVETQPGCRLCLEMQEKLHAPDACEPATHTCLAGLSDTSVPIRAGKQIIGFLQTGQVALKPLSKSTFQRVADWLAKGGINTDWDALENAYFDSPKMSKQQYLAVVRLLEVFAQHLSIVAEQIATEQTNAEPSIVAQARQYIEDHQNEEISLQQVAAAVHSSTFHFCRMFKKATGHTFTRYLALVRIAKAKQLLANPNKRVSEIAFETGFNSLTHFNRLFRQIVGQSPTEYRAAPSA